MKPTKKIHYTKALKKDRDSKLDSIQLFTEKLDRLWSEHEATNKEVPPTVVLQSVVNNGVRLYSLIVSFEVKLRNSYLVRQTIWESTTVDDSYYEKANEFLTDIFDTINNSM
jgi:hypothetical protein